VRVKGKQLPVSVYTVWEPKPTWATDYESGIQLYQKGEFAQAQIVFQELQVREPEDRLISIYAQRLAVLAPTPPTEWDGVYVMTKK
jgi:hypothetical protein